jgi:hypothetical protein
MRLFSEGLGLVTGLLLCAACTSADIGPDGSGAMSGQDAKSGASPHKGVDSSTVLESYGKLPMAFEKNQGQADHPVDFIARGAGYRVLLTRSEAVINLAAHPAKPSSAAGALRMSFVGARRDSAAAGLDPLPGKTSYFKGADPSRHLRGIESFAKVRYAAIYPGIDLVYYGNQRQLEYDLVVAPGGDPAQIRIAFEGSEHIEIDKDGNLALRTGTGDVAFQRPVVYQLVEEEKRIIEGRYVRTAERQVGFMVAAYDPQKPLVIDPVLSYATYLGGKANDVGTAIAVDAAGNAYVAGYTYSSDFPLKNPYDRSLGNGDVDAFVTKLNPTGSALVYSTYLGGRNGRDFATGIAVDSAGNAYVTGQTSGSDFPVTGGAYQAGATGGGAFVAKLNASGTGLSYSTYILGTAGTRIAVDAAGSAYLTGSATPAFATTPGAFQTVSANPGGANAFAAKLNPTGTGMVYATFLGGGGAAAGKGIAVDGNGNAFVAGSTNSDDFPVASALQAVRQGGQDGFVAKLNPSGTALAFSTYLGGSLDDSANAIAVDARGSAYVAGETYSADFPVRNAFQPTKAGYRLTNSSLGNAFVAKLLPAGDGFAYSSFLGGEICTGYCYSVFGVPQIDGDVAYGIAVDGAEHAYVTGLARSYTFPLVDSLQPGKQQDNENSLFVSKIGLAGNVLLYSTFVRTGYSQGSSLQNGLPYGAGNAIAIDGTGGAYVTTEDDAGGGFAPTTGAFQTVPKGGQDAVAFKLSAPSAEMALASSANPASSQAPITLTATVSDTSLAGNVIFMNGSSPLGSAPLNSGTATLTATLPAGIHRLTAVYRNNLITADSALLHQVVNTGLVCN